MDIHQIKELMALLEESKFSKLVFKKGDVELQLEKETLPPPRTRASPAETEVAFQSEAPVTGERGGSVRVEAPGTFVTSPMVGTYYGAPAPDQPPFVKVGDKVDEGTVVCIVEAMKVMNEVKAGMSGIVAEILADSSQPVEFGTRLLRIT
ncbi:MAG TPA: acetyl-CoA carboxylase biotin carboxyl carrier protein [Chlamydiales bacterium]|nr:acetyl-CoA carboxylase biotin carboxyl carrier protein [Chlamydiales bacterium]